MLSEIISEELVNTALRGKDVPSVLQEFCDLILSARSYNHPEVLFERLIDREKQGSTGIGNGIAIPHCKVENLDRLILAIGYSEEGVDFNAIDGKPSYFFFLVVSPNNAAVLHLRVLAALSRLLKSPGFMEKLRQRPSADELIQLIRSEESASS